MIGGHASARAIAAAVRTGQVSAVSLARDAIAALAGDGAVLNAATRVPAERALDDARGVDAAVAAGRDPGALAGVPFGVKDLFDVAGLVTTAGSALRRDGPVATRDAEAVRRFRAAGAVLVATLNMDEFAYGFATINAHHGTTRNPHDRARLAGGSSGGSAAAVAGGLVPLSLGSDTNGSIRVPAALCGIFGLKPTHGTLPMDGVAPFVASFDDIGPFATSVDDLLLAYEILRDGPIDVPMGDPPRLGVLGGWFARNVSPAMAVAIGRIARALDAMPVELPRVEAARSAAYVMTAREGGLLHLLDLRTRADAYDPQVRDRLIAGAMVSSESYEAATRFRRWFLDRAIALFERCDVLIAPAAACVAPPIEDPTILVDGARVPARSHLGLFTQPLSFIGLPALSVPVATPGGLPLGLQLIAAPGGEPRLFALAQRLEREGLVRAQVATGAPAPRGTAASAAQ